MVSGPKGKLEFIGGESVQIGREGDLLIVKNLGTDTASQALFGFTRAQLDNLITGVNTGWSKGLELSGVGYRAVVTGTNLVLNVGFSHPVTMVPPAGITFSVTEGKIMVSGIDKQLVGSIAAQIRAIKPPEPYKGKGIRYIGEIVRKKAGKSAKGAGAPAAGK